MLWFKKKKKVRNIDEEFFDRLDRAQLQIKRATLKERVRRACQDTTNYEQRLRDFCENNCRNIWLLNQVKDHRKSLIDLGYTEQQAAKATLEKLR